MGLSGSGHATVPPSAKATIATPRQALDLTHELLDTMRYDLNIHPANCYDLNVGKRGDGFYVVQVSPKPGQTCTMWSQDSFNRPFALEINSANGAATVINRPGWRNPRTPVLFDLQDNQGRPLLHEGVPYPWRLVGSTKRLRNTDQCLLEFAISAFERRNAYTFSLKAHRSVHVLTMGYYVNSVNPLSIRSTTTGGISLIRATTDSVGVTTMHETLATYPADLAPTEEGARTSNDVTFEVTVTQRDAAGFLRTLAKPDISVVPMRDGKPEHSLGLTSGTDFKMGIGKDLHRDNVRAFQRCLDVIWGK